MVNHGLVFLRTTPGFSAVSCDLISKMSSVSGMQRGGVAVGDGGWNLSVFVTDLQVERTLRVRGDVHIGGLMIRLVDELGRQTDGAAT